jgi:uncharacterized protein (TIGR02145 family)
MKKLSILIMLVAFNICALSQVPEKMSYQAVIRNANNDLITNQVIGMRISILQGSATGTPVFVETHTPNTNANGLVTIEIGGGTPVSGTFATVDWSAGSYFVKTEIDPGGGTTYTIIGTSQLLSVPYSLYAKTSATSTESIDLKRQIKILEDNLIEAGTYRIPDIEGNQYNVVKIGTQVWMKENLRTTKFNDGTDIPFAPDSSILIDNTSTSPFYSFYASRLEYGAYYNWYSVNSGKLCPGGWHVPSGQEWVRLTDYLGGDTVAGVKLIAAGHWLEEPPEPSNINESGFTALPAGILILRTYDLHQWAVFVNYNFEGQWWTSEKTDTSVFTFILGFDGWFSMTPQVGLNFGLSVRCIRD